MMGMHSASSSGYSSARRSAGSELTLSRMVAIARSEPMAASAPMSSSASSSCATESGFQCFMYTRRDSPGEF